MAGTRGRLPVVLNDMAWPLRGLALALGLPLGLMLGGIVRLVGATEPDATTLAVVPVLLLLAVGGFVVVSTVAPVLLARADRRLRDRARRLLDDPGRVAAHGARVPGRVVRTRPEGTGRVVAVCTALAPDAARRVVALAPYPDLRPGRPVALLLDPDDGETALLDDRVGPADLAAIDSDPRWRSWRLPTDGTVAGGWLLVTAAGLVGVLGGTGVSLLVLALVA